MSRSWSTGAGVGGVGSSGGRMDFDVNARSEYNDYKSYAENRSHVAYNSVADAVRGNLDANAVSKLFFGEMNVNAIQKGIKNMVLNKTCGKQRIGDQSYAELFQVMRAIYLKDSINSLYDVVGQVRNLNGQVLDFCVPRILTELEMHDTYINDISNLPVPLLYGESTSVAGTKTLELKRF